MGEMAYMYSALFHQNPDAVFIMDSHGHFIEANASGESLSGYSSTELCNMTFRDLFLPIGDQYSLRNKLGRLIEISLANLPVYVDPNIERTCVIVKDIRMQKKMEVALRQSQENFRLITENADDLIRILDRYGGIIYASPSHETVLGLTSNEVQNLPGFHSLIFVEDRQKAIDDFAFMVETRRSFNHEYRYQHTNGSLLLFEVRGTPVIGADGEMERAVIVARNISERRRSEELLRYSDKLSVLGELAAGIAHEIRNPLTAIKGFIQLLKSDTSTNQQYLQIVLAEIERINFITNELLVLAKPQALRCHHHALSPLVQAVIQLLCPQANLKNIRLAAHFPDRSPVIIGDEYQIKQVLINIIKNGMESMPSGGLLTIEVTQSQSAVNIYIRDQGEGIPMELIPRLGELFFSTKEAGTGLGLMVSSKIIRDHNGTIEITSTIGAGTTVLISLPAIGEAAELAISE